MAAQGGQHISNNKSSNEMFEQQFPNGNYRMIFSKDNIRREILEWNTRKTIPEEKIPNERFEQQFPNEDSPMKFPNETFRSGENVSTLESALADPKLISFSFKMSKRTLSVCED